MAKKVVLVKTGICYLCFQLNIAYLKLQLYGIKKTHYIKCEKFMANQRPNTTFNVKLYFPLDMFRLKKISPIKMSVNRTTEVRTS